MEILTRLLYLAAFPLIGAAALGLLGLVTYIIGRGPVMIVKAIKGVYRCLITGCG